MMDRIGHRKLQLAGFAMMGACFAVIALVPGMTTAVVPFLLVYGISYFFTEFGPDVTTFVIPGELFRTEVRATAHGIAAGAGRLGAFIGVFLFPVLQDSLGLRGTLLLTAAISACGALLTLVLPEPAGRALAEVSGDEAAAAVAAPAATAACRGSPARSAAVWAGQRPARGFPASSGLARVWPVRAPPTVQAGIMQRVYVQVSGRIYLGCTCVI